MKEIYENHEWFVENHVLGNLNIESDEKLNKDNTLSEWINSKEKE